MTDPWRRFVQIRSLVMQPCCVPTICEARLGRVPPSWCRLGNLKAWEDASAAWDKTQAEHVPAQAPSEVPK